MKRSKLLISMLTGASVLSMAAVAQAQAPAADANAVEEVVVTGSRVIQNGNNSPTPVTVVSTQQLLQNTPSTVADALYKLPVFATTSAQTRAGGAANGNTNANGLNLRNIGAAYEDTEIYGPSTPQHAQFRQRLDHGSLWTMGVKGTF